MKSSCGSIVYGRQAIAFKLFRMDRKTMEIAVHPDQSVVVKVPLGADIELIQKKIVKRASWIVKKRAFFKQFDPRTPLRRYVGGETHLYLGKQFRLKIRKGNHDHVKLIKGFFEIQVHGRFSSDKVKSLLEEWYSEKAARKFNESINRCWPYVEKSASVKPRLQIKHMRKRWGSLSANGTLTLNTNLLKAPKECIDYVITHELSHLRCNNHGPAFYRILDKVMPDWEKRKHRLEVTLA